MLIASTTKLMTALVCLEQSSPNLMVTVKPSHCAVEGSSMGLRAGERYSVQELVTGLLLASGNDAALALADAVGGSEAGFVRLMNQKAKQLTLKHTHFANPHGLDAEMHYSTARDLARLMCACMENEAFCKISGRVTAEIHGAVYLNHNKLLTRYPGCIGGKTGYTTEAGRCLASHAEVNGMHLILVTGQSEGTGHVADAATLYNWYAQNYSRRTILEAGQSIASIPVVYSLPEATLETSAADTVTMDLPSDAEVSIVSDLPETIEAPISAGQQLGTYSVSVNDQILYTASAVSDQSVSRSTLAVILARLDDLWTNHRVFAIALIVLILLLIRIIHVQIHNARVRKKRRNRKHRRHS